MNIAIQTISPKQNQTHKWHMLTQKKLLGILESGLEKIT